MEIDQSENLPSTRDYFLTKNEIIPENLILFKDITMKIRNQNPCNYNLVYFQITNKPSCSSYSNIEIHKIGIQDRFSEYCGTYEYLLQEHKIDLKSLKTEIASIL